MSSVDILFSAETCQGEIKNAKEGGNHLYGKKRCVDGFSPYHFCLLPF
jgi:hypothetical protein